MRSINDLFVSFRNISVNNSIRIEFNEKFGELVKNNLSEEEQKEYEKDIFLHKNRNGKLWLFGFPAKVNNELKDFKVIKVKE